MDLQSGVGCQGENRALGEMRLTCFANIGWAINDRDPGVRYQEPDNVAHAVRKYVLAQGILRFKAKEGRWPTDFREAHEFIRKSNPLINLDPLTKGGDVKFVVQADGSLKVGGYFTLPK